MIIRALSLSLCLALPAFAQDATPTRNDEVVTTGQVRGGDAAMSAFLAGDFDTAEIEFRRNFDLLTRNERLKDFTEQEFQNSALTALSTQGVPQVGAQGGAANVSTAPQSVTLPTLSRIKPGTEDTLTSGGDRGFQLYMVGLSQIQLGKYSDAEASLERALGLNGTIHDARARLGLVYLNTGNTDGARKQLDRLTRAKDKCKDFCRKRDAIHAAHAVLAPYVPAAN